MKLRNYLSYLSILLVSVYFVSCSSGQITPEMIEEDLVGQKVGGFFGWTFAEDEPREIKIIEKGYNDSEAVVVISIVTNSVRDPEDIYSGKLQLEYKKVGDMWVLDEIENLTFEKQKD